MKPFIFLFAIALSLPQLCLSNGRTQFNSGNTALSQNEYREAMLLFQQAVRESIHSGPRANRLHAPGESNYVELEDPVALTGLAHFERGNYLFQSRQRPQALVAWETSLHSLTTAADTSLSSRVYLALYLYANNSTPSSFDLINDDAFRIADQLDSLPKSPFVAEQPNQVEAEYVFITGYRIAQQMLEGQQSAETPVDLFSERLIYNILVEKPEQPAATRKSHESAIDDLLFSNADSEIASRITKLHYAIILSAAPNKRADLLAQHLQWLALCKLSPNPLPREITDSIEDWFQVGDHIIAMLQLNARFRIPQFEQHLWQTLEPYLDQIRWADVNAALQACDFLAQNGFSQKAKTMAQSLLELNLSSEQRIRASITLLKADFGQGAYLEAITTGLQLLESPVLSPLQKAEVNRDIGLSYAQLSDFPRAIEHIQAFLKERPVAAEAPSLLFLIATLYLNTGMRDEATNTFEQLIAQYPQSIYTNRARRFLFALQQ